MTLGIAAQWFAFVAFSLIGLAGALGMATTMSMFRSGIFLMASFLGVAGLFILLSADLLSLLQIMMYIGGMLVMILFMVLFSHDPGGAMMAAMKMARLEKFFSLGIKPMRMDHGGSESHEQDEGNDHQSEGHHQENGGEQHEEHRSHGEKHQHQRAHHEQQAGKGDGDGQGGHGEHGGHEEQGGHGGMDMSMTTPVKRHAAVLAALMGLLLVGLLLARPNWAVMDATPNPNSAQQVGSLLMGKYMMAFEGAGLLILLGIFGAVWLARPGEHPGTESRDAPVAEDGQPASLREDRLQPIVPGRRRLSVLVPHDIHADRDGDHELADVPEESAADKEQPSEHPHHEQDEHNQHSQHKT